MFGQFSNHCLANAIEPLRAANMLARRQAYEWQFLTLDGAPVSSSSGLTVSPHGRLGSEGGGDILFVLPSYEYLSHATPATARGLRSAAKRYRALAGFDTGSWLMADAGLLDHARATIHWEELQGFQERFPEVDVLRERFVIDENRLTCSGASAAFDLVLRLIGDQHGESLALDVATLFMQSDETGDLKRPERRYSRTVSRALAIMQENIEEPLTMPSLAGSVGQAQRAIALRFSSELGATPQAVYKRLRLGLARKLAEETDLPVSEISIRSGYANASAMTRAFRAEFGACPRTIREKGI